MPLAALTLEKTGGSPFFINEFLKSLHTEGYLRLDPGQGGWQWDLARLKAMELTDNVVDLLIAKIRKLGEESQHVLKLAACVGSHFDLGTLSIICEQSPLEAAEALEEAISWGFVFPSGDEHKLLAVEALGLGASGGGTDTARGGGTDPFQAIRYRFSHDRIQQAAYTLIPDESKQAVHLRVGRLLLENTPEERREQRIFDIVNHLDQGASLMDTQGERAGLAGLNLQAGRKAKASAAYSSALRYFDTGIGLLGKNRWEKERALARDLCLEAAEAAFQCAEFDRMERLVAEVLEHSDGVIERVKAYEIKIWGCIAMNRTLAAVEAALQALMLLGLKFPGAPRRSTVLIRFLQTKLIISRKRIEDLAGLPEMDDPYMLAASRILCGVSSAAHLAAPLLSPLLVFKMVQLSVKYGNTDISPYAYTAYGAMLCGVVGDIEAGYRFGRLGLHLLEKTNAPEHRAKTLFAFNGFVRHWKEHVRDSLEPLMEGYQSGLEVGDFNFSALCVSFYCIRSYCIGRELPEIELEIAGYGRILEQYRQEIALNFTRMFRQVILNLMGKSEDPCLLVGESYNERVMLPLLVESGTKGLIFTLYYNKVTLCYLFHRFREAVENATLCERHLESAVASSLIPPFYFMDSLARLAALDEYPEERRHTKGAVLQKVSANQKKMKQWADHAPMNCLHRLHLVEAELDRLRGQWDAAGAHYDQAIDLAGQNGYPQEKAIAQELTARFYLGRGREKVAASYMADARYGYLRWGAGAKVVDLDRRYPALLASRALHTVPAQQTVASTPTSAVGACALDLTSIIKASQVISGEIILEKLLAQLMRIVMENAGAQEGFLILKGPRGLTVEAQAAADTLEVVSLQTIPVDECEELSAAIVHYVERTHERVVLDNASATGIFTQDEHVMGSRPKSILCIPIMHHATLTGVLYLENNLTVGAFTPWRVEVLGLLTSQAAISIENARLYTRIKESEEKFRGLYENAVEGIFQVTADNRLAGANPSLARIMGFDSPEELLAKMTDLSRQLFVEGHQFEEIMRALDEKDSVIGYEARVYRKGRKIIWVSISAHTVRGAGGKPLYYEGSILDVTEHKEKEEAQRERATAEAANRAKGEFLAAMSHEIRTPMNAIIGMTDLTLRTELVPKQREYLSIVDNSARSLLGVLNDILDFSRIEAGKLHMESAKLDIRDVIESVMDMFGGQAAQKGIEIVAVVASDVPQALRGDPLRLRQILVNLASNAVKFTEKGEILLSVSHLGGDEEKVRLLFSVRDTGIGISPESMRGLFDAFTQADGSITRKYGGTGLGLSISKRLVEMMEGEIWVESRLGQGSDFSFTARLGRVPGAPLEAPVLPSELAGIKALIVDGNVNVRAMLDSLLRTAGLETDSAASVQAAVKSLRKSREAGEPFGLVLLDLGLLDRDGISLARAIREDGGLEDLPIIMMVPLGIEEQMGRVELSGRNGLLIKPVKRSMLFESIMRAMGCEPHGRLCPFSTRPDGAVAEEPYNLEGARVLLVEDNAINRQVASEILRRAGVVVETANNGLDAMEALRMSSYDLILMDVQMPIMDGIETTRLIRKNPALKSLPIVAMTAHAMKGDREWCMEAGMNDYVSKPVDHISLIAALRHWIGGQEKGVSGEGAPHTAPGLADPEPTAAGGPGAQRPVIDMEGALRRLCGNRELLEELLLELAETYGNVTDEIRSHLENRDMDSARQLAHSLKGTAGNLSAEELHHAAKELEQAIRQGDPEDVEALLNAVEAAMGRITELVKSPRLPH